MRDWQKITAVGLWASAAIGLSEAAIADVGGIGGGLAMMMGGKGGMDVAAMFATMDADKDGKVTQIEIDANRATRVAEVDANKDGLLSAEELVQMQIAAMTERATAMAAKMVSAMDSDADGLVSAAELAAGRGPSLVVDQLDTDGDGAISQAEMDAGLARMDDRGARGERGGRGHHGGHGGHGWGDGWGMFGGDATL